MLAEEKMFLDYYTDNLPTIIANLNTANYAYKDNKNKLGLGTLYTIINQEIQKREGKVHGNAMLLRHVKDVGQDSLHTIAFVNFNRRGVCDLILIDVATCPAEEQVVWAQ